MVARVTNTPFFSSFLGSAPVWYKYLFLGFLFLNPLLMVIAGEKAVAYAFLGEFIFALAMALYCYPLQPGGLLALQAILLGLTSPAAVYAEIAANLPVFLLLMYMVAAIYFMKELLLVTFTRILLWVHHRVWMNTLILITSAILSAFLDALTVMAVLIAVTGGFYAAFPSDTQTYSVYPAEALREEVRRCLTGMVMHGAIGTAVGGVCTLVGEPQNLLIAQAADWDFVEFAVRMAPVTIPCAIVAILTCIFLEYYRIGYYGNNLTAELTQKVAANLEAQRLASGEDEGVYRVKLTVQAICALLLCIALLFHLAEVGLIGLTILVLLTAFTGVVTEHKLGAAFHEAMPFTALLCCFFAIVAIIHDQHLFDPVTNWVRSFPDSTQPAVLFIATGFLSVVSDNVFVATIYIGEILADMENALMSREHFNRLAVAINTGTNLPSIATPNGQAAFLFLLTSSLAPMLGLSYMRMVVMALPYTLMLSLTGFVAIVLWF